MTGNTTNYKNRQGDNSIICSTRDEISQPYRAFSLRAATGSSLYICHTIAMTTLVEYGTRCLYENTNFLSVLIVRSASSLKLKNSHFWKCCEENVYLCARLIQNRMEIFSATAKLFVWRLRLRVQKAQSPHYWHMGCNNLKSVNQYKYLVAVLNTELPDDKDIQRQLR